VASNSFASKKANEQCGTRSGVRPGQAACRWSCRPDFGVKLCIQFPSTYNCTRRHTLTSDPDFIVRVTNLRYRSKRSRSPSGLVSHARNQEMSFYFLEVNLMHEQLNFVVVHVRCALYFLLEAAGGGELYTRSSPYIAVYSKSMTCVSLSFSLFFLGVIFGEHLDKCV
jgi:hypothetical protein